MSLKTVQCFWFFPFSLNEVKIAEAKGRHNLFGVWGTYLWTPLWYTILWFYAKKYEQKSKRKSEYI